MRRRNYEKGRIVAQHSLMRYDVLIPGRPEPWTRVGTLNPAWFDIGEIVTIGFVEGNLQLPVILSQKEWRQSLQVLDRGIAPRDWTHFLGDSGRKNLVSFGFSPEALDLYVPICDAWVTGEAVYRQTRVLQNVIYANLMGGGLAKLDPSMTFSGPFEAPAWQHGFTPTDLFIDQASNSIYVQQTSNGMIRRGSALDLTTTWSSPVLGTGFVTIPLCLGFHRAEQVVACLCTAPHPQDTRRFLWLQGFKAADGERVFSVPLTQQPEPPFAPNEVVPLVTWHARVEYWNRNGDPGIRWSNYNNGSSTIGTPWARIQTIDRSTIGNTSPADVIGNQPTTLDWGAVPAEPNTSRIRMSTSPDGAVSNDSIIVPSCFSGILMPTLVAYNLNDGSKAWEKHGATTTEANDQSQFRDWFLPRMIVGNKLVCVTRKHEFLTNDVDFRIFGEDVVPQYDESITYSNGTHPWYGDRATPKLVEIQQRRCRVQKSVHFYLETFDVRDGSKLSSVRMYNKAFTSLFHLRGEWIGSLGAPYWRTLLDDNLEYPYDGPTYLERYGPTGRAPLEVVDPVNVGEKFYWAVGADGNEFVVLQAKRFAYRRPVQGNSSVYRGDTQHTYTAREFSGSWDLQDYPHLSTPILNTNRTKVIFARNPGNFSPLTGNYSHGQRKMDWLPGSNDWMSWGGGTQANGWENNVTITSPDLHRDRIHFQAFDLDPAAPSWRHTMIFPSGASVQIGLAACGANRMVIPYTLAGVRRLRVVDDSSGQQLADVAMQMPTGLAPGAPQYTILCGNIAVLVSQGAIHQIKSSTA